MKENILTFFYIGLRHLNIISNIRYFHIDDIGQKTRTGLLKTYPEIIYIYKKSICMKNRA